MELKFDNFSILVKDFIREDYDGATCITTDSEISIKEFPMFIDYYKRHLKEKFYFNQYLDGEKFHGRFGQLIYSLSGEVCKMRLVLVEKVYDDVNQSPVISVIDRVDYINMKKLVVKQDIILDQLKRLLEQKEIFTKEELDLAFQVHDTETLSRSIALTCEVENLEEYLSDKNENLSQIASS